MGTAQGTDVWIVLETKTDRFICVSGTENGAKEFASMNFGIDVGSWNDFSWDNSCVYAFANDKWYTLAAFDAEGL